MPNLISGSCFIQAAMLRMCLWMVFIGIAVEAHTAQSAQNSFAPDLEILTIQPLRSGAGWLLPYRLNASVVLTRSADTVPAGPGFSSTPRWPLVAEPKKEAVWPTNAGWQIASSNDRASLSPLLRLESKGGRIEIKPRRNSVGFAWRKAFP